MRFRTSVKPTVVSRFQGRMVTVDDWDAVGGREGAMVPGWQVERPDWWVWGRTSGIADQSVEVARARLDEWQDDQWKRSRAPNK